MYILILLFILLYSVFSYADCFSINLTQPYGYIKAPYFSNPYSAEVCEWVLDLGYYNVLEIRIESVNLAFGDFMYIRDGLSFNSQILVKLYGSSSYRKFTTSTGSAMIYFSRSQKTSRENNSQFNITYQIKGRCIPVIQSPCSESELSCYDLRYESCDSIWNCPVSGRDEQNCLSCQQSQSTYHNGRFPCSEVHNSKCYARHQRCDGFQDCDSLADETNCDPLLCGEHNNTFLCLTFPSQCISNSLRCDGTSNCRDGSDERNCVTNTQYFESGRFRVIIVSSLSAILFMVMVALGFMCICRLHKIRVMSSRSLSRHRGQSLHDDSTVQLLIDEEMRRRPPPPNYLNAIRYSRPFRSMADLQRLIYPPKKNRSQHKSRSHRNRHSENLNPSSTNDSGQFNNPDTDLLNNTDDCPKDSDCQLLVPGAFNSDNEGCLMSDSELIDPGTVDHNNDDDESPRFDHHYHSTNNNIIIVGTTNID